MRRQKTVFDEPGYKDFCIRYRHDLLRYVIEVCNGNPTYQQVQIIKAIQEPGSRTCVASGMGIGKTRVYAWFADWLLKTYPYSNTILTGAAVDQLGITTWKELEDLERVTAARVPWLNKHFVRLARSYFAVGFQKSWWVAIRTAPKGKSENLSGQHRQYLTIIIEEASAVNDENISVLTNTCTHKDNRIVAISQHTRLTGWFHDTMTSPKGLYQTFRFNAEESPLVSRKSIQEKLIKYGGHHSWEYQVKVLGNPPDQISGYLISRAWAMEAQGYKINWEGRQYGYILASDVGEGTFRDSSVAIVWKCSIDDPETRILEPVDWLMYNDKGPKQFAREAYQLGLDYENVTHIVDAVGVGLGMCEELEELGASVVRLNWGALPQMRNTKKRFINLRSHACYLMRCGILEGRQKIIPGTKVLDQIGRLPYSFNERGQYVMMPKKQMREKESLPSPDIADAHAFPYLCDPVPVNSGYIGQDKELNELLSFAQEALEG